MHVRTLALLSTFAAASMLLQGCGSSGGGGTLIVPGPGPSGNPAPGPDPSGFIADSVAVMNAFGSPIMNNQDYSESVGQPGPTGSSRIRKTLSSTVGKCVSSGKISSKFIVPDTAGNPNSTERFAYYDNVCNMVATDTDRVLAATPDPGALETVNVTVTKYLPGNYPATKGAQRTEKVDYSGTATFDQFGFPNLAPGLIRTESSQLASNQGVLTVQNNDEYILAAQSGNVVSYCADWAGYNAAGNGTATWGWTGQTDPANGTVTTNGNGSEVFLLNLMGSPYTAAPGSMSVAAGTPNTACPIAAPLFTVAGGTLKPEGPYTLNTLSEQFLNGEVQHVSVGQAGVPATFANGDTMVAQDNAAAGFGPGDPNFITGSLSGSTGSALGTFAVNGFGFGTLTVTAYGTPQKFIIVDWHVVQNFN